MAYDPFYSLNPSDSGLLDGIESIYDAQATPGKQRKAGQEASGNVPPREEYEAPEPGAVNAETPEDSLRDVPLPEGFAARLRGFVGDL
ncbi:MAG: hypothetical protein AAF266_10055 [Planctomycetota bacterium]